MHYEHFVSFGTHSLHTAPISGFLNAVYVTKQRVLDLNVLPTDSRT